MNSEKGFAFIETVVALALLGIIGVAFLNGLATSSKATVIANDEVTAVSLAQAQIEWVKKADYVYEATGYSAAPIPSGQDYTGYSVQIDSAPLNSPDDGIQKITVTVKYWGEDAVQLDVYKVDK